MTTGRKPKPTNLKLVTGNPGKRALPKNEAKPARTRPSPPSFLTVEAAEEWSRVVDELYTVGLVTGLDRGALAAYCMAFGRWAQAEKALNRMAEHDPKMSALMIKTTSGNAIQNPLVGTANRAAADMVRYAAEFGMTPSARSRVNAEPNDPTDEKDPAAEFFG